MSLGAVLAATAACSGDPRDARDRFLARADAYAVQGKTAEAIIEYRNAIQVDPLWAPAHVKLAESYIRSGNVQGAAGEYVRAADLRPEDGDLQVKAGAFLLFLGRPQEAADRARRALALNPRHARAQVLMSGSLANLKEFGGALAAINKAIELEPGTSGPYAALGALQLEQGQLAEAQRALKRAVSLDPTSTAVRLLLARFYFVTGRIAEAEKEFRGAVTLAPREPSVNRALASFLIATRRLPEAEPFLRTIADVTGQADAQLLLADFYASTGQPERASALLRPLISAGDVFAAASVRLAALEYALGHRAQAHARLGEVLRRDPSHAMALAVSAEFLLRERRFDPALATATQATEADPQEWRLRALLARIHTARQDTVRAIAAYQDALRLQPVNGTVLRELARLSLASGDPDRALRFAEDAIAAGVEVTGTRLLLVRALLARRELNRARAEIRQLALQEPGSAPVQVEQGVLAALEGRVADARQAFALALTRDPNSTEALSGLAALDIADKKPEVARARATRWVAERPSAPLARLAAARVMMAAGDHPSAERLLRGAIGDDPSNLGAYVALAQLYLAGGRLDESRKEFDAAAVRSPQPVAALTMSGSILLAQNRVAEARERFERALQADARAAVAANNLAWIYAESGEQLDTALHLAQVAKRELGEVPEVLDTLGWVYLKKNLPTIAIPLFEQNVRRDPGNAGYQHHLGLAYASAGDVARARGALQRAVDLAPGLTGAREALAALPAHAGAPRGQ
ncbi:MAG TPA: tetratricopeptide repeat protein [Vicinamibacterales bacterium]|nr:tetratricopeptide repeat protein [Vicinamibacterales bacterium]